MKGNTMDLYVKLPMNKKRHFLLVTNGETRKMDLIGGDSCPEEERVVAFVKRICPKN